MTDLATATDDLRQALDAFRTIDPCELSEKEREVTRIGLGLVAEQCYDLAEKFLYTRECMNCHRVSIEGQLCRTCERGWTPRVAAL